MTRKWWSGVLSCGAAVCVLAAGISVAEDGSFRLTLDEARRLALSSNLELVSARYGPAFAEQDIVVQDSGFDVGFEASLDHNESKNVASQASTVTGNKSDNVNAGVAQDLKYGANYSAGFGINKAELTGPNVLAPLSYFSGFNFAYTQPILKGFGTDVTTEALILARNDLEISRHDLEGQAETVIETVEGAYWDVVASQEELRIARLSLRRSQDLLELNRKKVEVGTLAPIEITQARAGVASNEETVIVAETGLQDAEDELRRLLAIPDGDPRWMMSIDTPDRPEFGQRDIDLTGAIDTALSRRAEMFRIRQTLRNRELSERIAERQVKHQLDFVATYGPTGASQDFPAIGPIPATSADLGDSLSNIFDGEVYSWTAQLVYRVPIGNRFAKSAYTTARLSREQSEVEVRNQEQSIRVEVRRAVRGVESGMKRVDAARINVQLQQEKLDAEEKKFQNGMSTSFEVLQFQEDLANAELSLVRAGLAYAKSLAGLERAKGTLLEDRGLRID